MQCVNCHPPVSINKRKQATNRERRITNTSRWVRIRIVYPSFVITSHIVECTLRALTSTCSTSYIIHHFSSTNKTKQRIKRTYPHSGIRSLPLEHRLQEQQRVHVIQIENFEMLLTATARNFRRTCTSCLIFGISKVFNVETCASPYCIGN